MDVVVSQPKLATRLTKAGLVLAPAFVEIHGSVKTSLKDLWSTVRGQAGQTESETSLIESTTLFIVLVGYMNTMSMRNIGSINSHLSQD